MTSPDHTPNSGEPVRPSSLICEPDTSTLVEWRKTYPEDNGKFIRVGDLVLFAPGFHDPLSHERLKHLDILWGAFQGENEQLKTQMREASNATTEPVIRDNGNLVDAGHYTSQMDEAGDLTLVAIWGDSYDFGRAEDEGREKTVRLIQERLAPIAVRSVDY